MLNYLRGWSRRVARSRAAYAAFLAPSILAIIAFGFAAVPGWAQQGLGVTQEQLLQLGQQSFGQNQGLPGSGGVYNGQQPDMTVQNYLPAPRAVPLPPSRLEQIMSARVGIKLEQFGYDQFGSGRAVVIAQTGAVQNDYVLGPGDQIVISLRGQENSQFRIAVDRNGQVILPRLPPISATGRTFSSFRQDLEAAVHRAYVATDAYISIAAVRQISVLVSGEVNNPGVRTLSGLASAVDALLLSGGVKKTGSLRNIRIQRAGHEYTVDIYNVLTSRGSPSSLSLADGDRILVPPLGRTVAVSGLVRKPGIFELPVGQSSMTVRNLLALGGGQEVRGRYRLSLMRIAADGQSTMDQLSDENGTVGDSEILFVQLGADQAVSQATLSGGTGLAGQYAIRSGTKLSEVLKAPGALGQSPYTLFGIIVRRDPRTLLRSLVSFTPMAVLNGTEDQELQTDDVIRVISVNEAQLLTFVVKTYIGKLAADQAAQRNPLADEPNANDPTLVGANSANKQLPINPNDPALLTAQGQRVDETTFGADVAINAPADLQRADITALLDVAAPGTALAHQQTTAFTDILSGKKPGESDASTPPSPLLLQQQALAAQNNGLMADSGYGGINLYDQQNARAGQNNPLQNAEQPGAGHLNNLPPNYMDQPAGPGGYASNREVKTFGQLSQQLGMDPLVLVNFLIDHRARLDGAVAGPGFYFVGPNVALADLVQAAGGTSNWADRSGVDLMTTVIDAQNGHSETQRQTMPLRQGMLASYIVRPRDQFRFNQIYADAGMGSVTIQGEVHSAGSYPIVRGEHLSDLLMRTGGLTSTAYPTGTVFLRKSAAAVERDGYIRAANEIQNQLLAGMARVGNDKIPPETFAAMQTFINRLRTQKAMGRVSFQADPSILASHPELDPLLEPGDAIYIPQRPGTISVLGEVMQPGTYAYEPGRTLQDYIRRAGGYAQFSNDDLTFVVLPDGTARKVEKSWFGFDANTLPPGSAIVVPRDLTPIDTRQLVLDITGIFSQLAVSLASLAVISRN